MSKTLPLLACLTLSSAIPGAPAMELLKVEVGKWGQVIRTAKVKIE